MAVSHLGLIVAAALSSLAPVDEPRVIAGVGFAGSEAARHDVDGDRYLVTNLGTRGAANDGFIAVLSPDLSVRDLKWIEGGANGVELRDPLGLVIAGDTIYVADVDAVRRFDRVTGAPRGSTRVPGAVRLNDLAVDPAGVVYVTDSGNETTPGAIYRISPEGEVTEFAPRSPELMRPNGVALTPDGTIVHGGLGDATLVYRDEAGRIVRQRTLPTGRLDGIVALPDGSLFVASQNGHVVYRVPGDAGQEPEVVAHDIATPAAIGVDVGRGRLLIPQIAAASLTVVQLRSPPVETRPRNAVDLAPAFEGQTRAPQMASGVAFETTVVASGLNKPWGMTFLPDGRLLVTERTTIRAVSPDGAMSAPIQGVPAVDPADQGGVLDIVLDPDFGTNRLVYFAFSEPGDPPLTSTAVARARLMEDAAGLRLDGLTVIFSQQPKLDSRQHYGGRLVFDRQGALFVTTGERFVPAGRPLAQGLDNLLGKVVRLHPDGSVPADNPFVSEPGARPEIWSYGHRNVQGAAIHPVSGRLWTIEHGPRGGDELNLPEPGANFGWPVVTYGIEYDGSPVGASISQQEGTVQPRYYWDPVIAPSGMAFYESDAVPAWRDSLFVAALRGKHLVRLTLDGDQVVGEERLLTDRNERLRDVEVGPDGSLWVLTDGANASLLKLTPTR